MKYTEEHLRAMGVNGAVAKLLLDLIERVESLEWEKAFLEWQIDCLISKDDTESV